MKKLLCIIGMSAVLFLLWTVMAQAVPACPEPIPFTQPNGEVIQVILRGDEFLDWVEDERGCLIIFDEAEHGFFHAVWTDGGPVSTGELVGEAFPSSVSMGPVWREWGANIPQAVLDRAAEAHDESMPDADEPLTPPVSVARPSAAPVVNSAAALKRNLLIIHVRWNNESNIPRTPLTGQQLYDRVFNPNTRSVNNYYMELFGADEDIIIPANVTNPLGGYPGIIEVTLSGAHTNPGGDSTLQREVLRMALEAASPYIDFSKYDTNRDKILQTSELSIGVIVHGYERSITVATPNFWGVSFTSTFGTFNSIRVRSIFGQGAYHGEKDSAALTIGVICHELGHSGYNFDDTYDYGDDIATGLNDGQSQGHGYWSLMSSGSWSYKSGENQGATPSYVDAYNLVAYNIVTPGDIPGIADDVQLTSHLDIYKAASPVNSNQYFLLQQRKNGTSPNYDQGTFSRVGGTATATTGGLLIFHIDKTVNLTRINDKNTHYRAAIEEAHGGDQRLQMVSGGDNGNISDLWGVNQSVFSETSDPSSGLYSSFTRNLVPPTQNTPSGVAIRIIWSSSTLTTTLSALTQSPYEELQAECVAVSGGNTVILTKDYAGTVQLTIGRDLTIDLNGHTLTIDLPDALGAVSNGIKVKPGITLTITDSSGGGSLNVVNKGSSSSSSGCGAAINASDGTLIIQSGKIKAQGGLRGAGIGGGYNGAGGTVTISGGNVTAQGGRYSAGIGGGYYGGGGKITISGGTVTAIASDSAAAIGRGQSGTNGTVTVIGTYDYWVSTTSTAPAAKTGTGVFTYSNTYKYIKLEPTLVRVTGVVKSYNPKEKTTIKLFRGNEVMTTTISDPTSSGQSSQTFTFENVPSGDYTLVITKPAHTTFTVQTIVVGKDDVDLTQDTRPDVRLITLRCGDINGDEMINDGDLTLLWLIGNYNNNVMYAIDPLCDLNGDGYINDVDLTILWLVGNYNKGAVLIG